MAIFRSTWTSKDNARLKGLILHHVSIGGSVLEACQQFEFETTGVHKAKSNRMHWRVYLQWTCKNEFKQALARVQDTAHTPPEDNIGIDFDSHADFDNHAVPERQTFKEAAPMSTQAIHGEDESSTRLLNAVSHILEDRRQQADSILEQKKLLELAQRKITDSEQERLQTERKLREKDSEFQKQERLLVDTQYKFQQFQDDYHQLMATRNSEYERLQQQIRELQTNYESLSGEYAKLRRDSSAQVEHMENSLRNAEMRNAALSSEAESVRKENTNLTRRITEFAQQISSMLGQSPVDAPSVTAVPIRPTLKNVVNED